MVDKIEKMSIKTITYKFDNLAQYSPQSYYLYIRGIKAKIGLPSSARLLTANIEGWSGLGATLNVSVANSDELLVLFQSGTTLSSNSYVVVTFVYI